MAGRRLLAQLRARMAPRPAPQTLDSPSGAESDLAIVRRARHLTQAKIGQTLKIDRKRVEQIEKIADFYVGGLRGLIEAMGGKLEITVRFGDRAIPIAALSDLADPDE